GPLQNRRSAVAPKTRLRLRPAAQYACAAQGKGGWPRATVPLLVHFLPGLVGIKFGYCARQLRGIGSQILLYDDAILVDHQCHHPRRAIFGRVGQECESVRHFSVNQVVSCAARCILTLPREHLVAVPMKRNWISVAVLLVPLCAGARDEWSNWALGLSFSGFPI